MTTTPTSGAADLPEALEDFELRKMAAIGPVHESNGLVERRPIVYRRELEDQFVRGFRAAESRRVAALAAGQAVAQDDLITIRKPTTSAEMLWLLKLAHLVMTDVDKTLEESFATAQPAAQQGVAYAALPDLSDADGEIWSAVLDWGHAKRGEDALRKASELERVLVDQLRAFADATCALRASHGQAPAYEAGWKDGYKQGAWSATAPTAKAAESVPAVDERAAFEAQFPVPGGVHWDGTKYVIKDSHISSYRCDRFVGQWGAWKASAARAPADSVTAPAGGVDDAVDAIALARYKVVPAHESMFHRFAVVAGDGKQQLYLGREIECANMARKFAGAFLDGAFYQANIAPTPPAQAADSVQEDAARYRWLTGDHHKHEVRAMVYEIATSMNVRGKGSVDAAIDAARKQGEKQ